MENRPSYLNPSDDLEVQKNPATRPLMPKNPETPTSAEAAARFDRHIEEAISMGLIEPKDAYNAFEAAMNCVIDEGSYDDVMAILTPQNLNLTDAGKNASAYPQSFTGFSNAFRASLDGDNLNPAAYLRSLKAAKTKCIAMQNQAKQVQTQQ